MTVSVSKINYGSIVGPDAGVTLSKISYGAITGPGGGATVSKLSFGIIVDTLTAETIARRRPLYCPS